MREALKGKKSWPSVEERGATEDASPSSPRGERGKARLELCGKEAWALGREDVGVSPVPARGVSNCTDKQWPAWGSPRQANALGKGVDPEAKTHQDNDLHVTRCS